MIALHGRGRRSTRSDRFGYTGFRGHVSRPDLPSAFTVADRAEPVRVFGLAVAAVTNLPAWPAGFCGERGKNCAQFCFGGADGQAVATHEEKRFVAHGSRCRAGTVPARRGPGPSEGHYALAGFFALAEEKGTRPGFRLLPVTGAGMR